MPTLTGTLAEITGSPIDPDSLHQVTVRAPSRRASLADPSRLVASVPVPVEVSPTGEISVELEPGPAVMLVEGEGLRDVYELYVTADMTLLTEAAAEAAPANERSWVESQMVQLRSQTVTAAADALEAAIAAGQDRAEIELLRQNLIDAANENAAPHLTQAALSATYGTKAELSAEASAREQAVAQLDTDKLDKAEAGTVVGPLVVDALAADDTPARAAASAVSAAVVGLDLIERPSTTPRPGQLLMSTSAGMAWSWGDRYPAAYDNSY